jgi:hypothetical protein
MYFLKILQLIYTEIEIGYVYDYFCEGTFLLACKIKFMQTVRRTSITMHLNTVIDRDTCVNLICLVLHV